MPALLFHPNAPGQQQVSPEARIASVAVHAYIAMALSSVLHDEGKSEEYIRERYFSAMARTVMELWPAGVDGYGEICAFAERHGLRPDVLEGMVQ